MQPVAPVIPPTPQKLQVRRPGPTHTATRVAHAQEVRLADGSTTQAQPGDWFIASGKSIFAVVTAATFPGAYEILTEGALTLTRSERDRLEQTLGLGTTRTSSECCAAVERLASLKIGEVTLDFTPGQWAELKHRATKRGQTLQQTVQAVVDRIRDEIFHRG